MNSDPSDQDLSCNRSDAEVRSVTTQTNTTWGIDRIDQRSLPLSGTFTYGYTGAGVKAYIIDTGIRFSGTEFGGRAQSGFDAMDGGLADDCNGHGTHVPGTAGGATYGVAKAVSLVAVRVLDCGGSGTWSGVIAGIDWVTADHTAGQPAVANMSLGGGASTSEDNAVRAMIADGVATRDRGRNGRNGGVGQDACRYSPSRVAEAMTVGATDQSDFKTSWSNYGSWSTGSHPDGASPRPGTRATPPPIRSVAPRWPRHTPPASPRFYLQTAPSATAQRAADGAPPGYVSDPAGLEGQNHPDYGAGPIHTLPERDAFRASLPAGTAIGPVNDAIARGCSASWIRAHLDQL